MERERKVKFPLLRFAREWYTEECSISKLLKNDDRSLKAFIFAILLTSYILSEIHKTNFSFVHENTVCLFINLFFEMIPSIMGMYNFLFVHVRGKGLIISVS